MPYTHQIVLTSYTHNITIIDTVNICKYYTRCSITADTPSFKRHNLLRMWFIYIKIFKFIQHIQCQCSFVVHKNWQHHCWTSCHYYHKDVIIIINNVQNCTINCNAYSFIVSGVLQSSRHDKTATINICCLRYVNIPTQQLINNYCCHLACK